MIGGQSISSIQILPAFVTSSANSNTWANHILQGCIFEVNILNSKIIYWPIGGDRQVCRINILAAMVFQNDQAINQNEGL